MKLVADCGRCVGLCCVAPAFVASADFAFSKPAGVACRHLAADSRCGIHDRLLPSGLGGCVAYDCFGAGQRVVALAGGGPRSAQMIRGYDLVRQLHELLWYATDALSRPAAAPVHPALAAAADAIDGVIEAGPATLEVDGPATHRGIVAPLLRRASALVRATLPTATPGHSPPATTPAADGDGPTNPAGRGTGPLGRQLAAADLVRRELAGADLVGRQLAGVDLRAADLSTAYLIGADLRGADLRNADLLGADLRGADLRGADLTGALYVTRTQLGGARGSADTRLPDRLPHPAHWLTAGSSAP